VRRDQEKYENLHIWNENNASVDETIDNKLLATPCALGPYGEHSFETSAGIAVAVKICYLNPIYDHYDLKNV
jgi:hypothetical protein